eukprot:gene17124-18847_t
MRRLKFSVKKIHLAYQRLSTYGVCISKQRLIAKISEAGKHHDLEILKRKEEVEQLAIQLLSVKDMLRLELKMLHNQNPQQHLEVATQVLTGPSPSSATISFVDESDIPLFHVDAQKRRPENQKSTTSTIQEIVAAEFTELATIANQEHLVKCEELIQEKCKLQTKMLQQSYGIVGDNLDFFIRVKHMSSTNQNKSIHWFNLLGLLNRVTGSDLDNEHPLKQVDEIKAADFIPTPELHAELLEDLVPLAARVIVDNIPGFADFKKLVLRHIEHKYSDAMKDKTIEIPLGLLMKNESIGSEMIEILEYVHEKYVPCNKGAKGKTCTQKVFFGGDNLTEERARNLQGAMAEGDTDIDRLEGIITKNEDWHAIRYMYKILYEIFYNEASAKDVGSMSYNMNLTRNSNARGNVLDRFNACKEFVRFETEALLVTLAMQYFGITNIHAHRDEVIPPNINDASKEEKVEWLYRCKCHKINRVEEKSGFGKTPKDDVYSYAAGRLNLGLLLLNVDDAVKEGDGERIIRCWRFFLLFYKAYGHHKYGIAAYHLLSRVTALLTPAQAEQLVWNRTVNKKGGKGSNISCDLRLEQLNCLTKEILCNLGVNLDESNAKRESYAIGFLEKILEALDKDLTIHNCSGHHKVKSKQKDFEHLVDNLSSKKIFLFQDGRQNEHFKDFDGNLLRKLDVASLSSWLKEMQKKLVKKHSKVSVATNT